MKFGGTSVEDPAAIARTAAIVAGRVAQGKSPVVVVSAMAKVTDQLLRAAACARRATAPARWRSARACARAIATPPARWSKIPRKSAALQQLIDQKFDPLDEVLRGLAAILELTPRISDLIVSYGESALQPHRRRRLPRARRQRSPRGRTRRHRHRLAVPEGRPARRRHRKARGRENPPPGQRRQSCRAGRLHRLQRSRHHHHPRPRRLRLYRRAHRRRHAPPTPSRSGPTWTAS